MRSAPIGCRAQPRAATRAARLTLRAPIRAVQSSLELRRARQRLRAAPRAARAPRGPPSATTASQKRRPARTGASSAPGPAGARAHATAARARGGAVSSPRAAASSEGKTSAPTTSIVCSACPSISDIAACIRSTSRQRSSPSVRRSSSPRRARSTISRSSPGPGGFGIRASMASEPVRVGVPCNAHLQPVDQLREHPAEVLAQPRRARELDGVGDLVDRHPQHQLVAVDAQGACGLREVGAPAAAAAAALRRRAARGRTDRAPAARAPPSAHPPARRAAGPRRSAAAPPRSPLARRAARSAASSSGRIVFRLAAIQAGGRRPRARAARDDGWRPLYALTRAREVAGEGLDRLSAHAPGGGEPGDQLSYPLRGAPSRSASITRA